MNPSVMNSPAPHASGRWRPTLLALAALYLLLFGLFAQGFGSMVALWFGSENYAHAVLVPPLSLWLVWRQRNLLATMTPAPAPLATWLLLAVLALWLVGHLVAVNALVHFTLVAALILVVPALCGWAVARRLMFPLGFLFLAVPFGEFLYAPMMEATADFTVAALRATGIPVYREGLQFVIPSGNWSVVEACSGLRYFVASTMVGVLFAHLNFKSMPRRLVFVAVALVVPLVANWVRAYLIVMIGHLSSNRLAVGVDHLIYGWVFFGIVMFLMFAIGARFADAHWSDAPAPLDPAELASRAGATGLVQAGVLTAVVMALAGGTAFTLDASRSSATPRLAPWSEPLAWRNASGEGFGWSPQMPNPRDSVSAAFVGPQGQVVGLYLGYYRRQNDDHKLVSSWNQLIGSKDEAWARADTRTQSIDFAHGALPLERSELVARNASARRLIVWRSYWIDDQWVVNPVEAKWLTLRQRLLGRGDDGAMLILYADASTQGGADAALQSFVKDNLPLIERQLRRVRSDHQPQ